ncbi:MAG: VCBS repeat-containing protein [Deltaproteobacteria bacterium]|nr:VCBS repeat-containing protein [Deltaproteobacteria bacterium]
MPNFLSGRGLAAGLLVLSGAMGCTRDFSVPTARTALSVTPAFARVAPAGKVDFSATGAILPLDVQADSRAQALGAQVTVDTGTTPPTIHFTAGTAGDLDETLTVKDGAGRTATATISVGPAVQLVPAETTVPSYGSFTFHAQNGQGPYTFATAPCEADAGPSQADGGTSYAYVAPVGYTQAEQTENGGTPKTEQVRAIDENGQCAQATVTIGGALEVIATGAISGGILFAHPGESVTLTGRGGQPPYGWDLSDASADAGTAGQSCDALGCINVDTGALTVSTKAQLGESFTVELHDALQNSQPATLTIAALAGPQLPQSVPSPPPGFEIDLPVSGGVSPYTFSYAVPASVTPDDFVIPSGNGSRGSLSISGHYIAGPNPRTTDVIRVTDALGASQTLSIDVGDNIIPQRREPLVANLVFQNFPFLNGQLYLPGLHLAYGDTGLVSAYPFPLQRILDFGDFNGDGLPDALVLLTPTPPLCDERTEGQVVVYTGTINGDVAYYGGGAVAEGAAVIPQQGRGPEVVLLNPTLQDGDSCTFAVMPLSRLAGGALPTQDDCFQPNLSDPCTDDFLYMGARAVLRLDNVDPFANGTPKAAVASVGVAGAWIWRVDRKNDGSLDFICQEMHEGPNLPDCDGCTLRLDAPMAVDLNGDGVTDLAWLVHQDDPPQEVLSAVITGTATSDTPVLANWQTSSAADSPLLNVPPSQGVLCGQLMLGAPYQGRTQVAYSDGLVNEFLFYGPGATTSSPDTWQEGSNMSPMDEVQLVGAGDIDGDGIYDVAARVDGEPTSFHFGSGDTDRHVFDASSHRFYAGPLAPPITFVPVDLDRDGHQDLVLHSASNSEFLLGRPGGLSFLQDAAIPGLTPLGIGDFNGDGFPDSLAQLGQSLVFAPFLCSSGAGPTGPCRAGQLTLPVDLGIVTADRACQTSLRNVTPVTLSALDPAQPYANLGGELLATFHAGGSGCLDSPQQVRAFTRPADDGGDSTTPGPLEDHVALDLSGQSGLSLISFLDLDGDGVTDGLFFFSDGIDTIIALAKGEGAGATYTMGAPDFGAGKLADLDGTYWKFLPDPAHRRVVWLALNQQSSFDVNVATLAGGHTKTTVDLGDLRIPRWDPDGLQVAGGSFALMDFDGDGTTWLLYLAEDDHQLFTVARPIGADGALGDPVFTHVGAGNDAIRAMQLVDLDGPDDDGHHHPSLILAFARNEASTAQWLQVWSNGGSGQFKPASGR